MNDNNKVLFRIDDNQGYAPEQIETSYTLGELLADLQDAIADHGEDAVIILSNGQRYGAGYGRVRASYHVSPFAPVDEEDEDTL